MRESYQKYLDNLAKANELVKKDLLNASKDKEAFIEQIRNNSRQTIALRRENDILLDEILYSRKAEDLTSEDVAELKELADHLFIYQNQTDVGTSYRIHQLLYEYAELTGDIDLRIRQLYHMGAALFYINPLMTDLGINLFGKQAGEHFMEGARYLPEIEKFSDPATQGYIIRCLTNLCISDERYTCKHQPGIPYDTLSAYYECKKYYDWMTDFYQSAHYREITPDFNWETAIYNLNYNLCLYYQFIQKYHPPEVIESLLKAATFIHSHQEEVPKFKYTTKQVSIEQIYATIRWKAGQITVTELADTIYEMIERADPNDFSMNGIALNLHMPLHFEYAFSAMNRTQRAQYQEKMDLLNQQTNDYLLRAPRNEFSKLIIQFVGESIRYRAKHNLPLKQQFFDSLLFCHPPTYIHVRTTAWLSRKLFLRLMDTNTEALLNLYDINDVDELREHRDEFADRIYHCALYHDVGKIMLLDNIGIYTRALLDEEFAVIKLHTNIGAALLEKMNPKELSVIALHHHRFYNERGGYPETCPPCHPQYKPIVDIISVADSVEAATDNIGRCYSVSKDLRAIVNDMKQQVGTRYSPDVIALFDDESFFREIEQELENERIGAYHETYINTQKKRKALL